jgi:hypothetical protein
MKGVLGYGFPLKSPRKGRGYSKSPRSCPSRQLEGVEKKKRVQGGLETGQRFLYPGDRTYLVKGLDLSGGTPDRTCPVRAEFPERDRVLNNSLDLLNI